MAQFTKQPTDHLPLSVPIFQILLTLCREAMHGYAILADIRARTDTAVELGAGTLYAAIKRMLMADMVAECDPPAHVEGEDSRRKFYEITAYGREVATAEAVRLQRLTALAQDRDLIHHLTPAQKKS